MGSSIYESYARSVYQARATIRLLASKFTIFTGEPPEEGVFGNWEPWLFTVTVEVSEHNSAIEYHRSAGNIDKFLNLEKARSAEVLQYNTAVENLKQHLPELRELESTGELFCSVEDVASEFRYIVDEGVKEYFWMEQRDIADLLDTEFDLANCTTHFLGPKRIGLIESQTDAVRIQANNVVLRSIDIVDERDETHIGHRDGVQLIPPNLMDEGRILTDRMAGSLMSDILVDNCTIDAPMASLQGIFSSDGFCRNVTISNNRIKTAAGHFISITGALDGCKFLGNTLQQASDSIPQIKLFPGRLGGNMADDGIAYILSFAENNERTYGEVENVGNQYLGLTDQVLPDQFSDERHQIPAWHSCIALGLRNFNYDSYMATYSHWTLADYKLNDPIGFRRLRAWLELRIEEYDKGKRVEFNSKTHPILPEPTEEQKTRVIHTLRPALALLNDNTDEFLSTRVADLHSMPIRSFIIKRLAVKEGDLVLDDINVDDAERRTAQLRWYLDDELPVDKDVEVPDDTLLNDTQELPKNYGELKIMATPSEIVQGQTVTFSVNDTDFMKSGDKASYYWMVKDQAGNKPTLELDTSQLVEGEHSVRATLYVRPVDGGLVSQVPASALFMVKIPEPVLLEKPLQAFGHLKQHLQVNCAKINRGKTLVVSLDQAFLSEKQLGGTLSYYWTVKDCPASKSENYEIDTSDLNPGKHTVRVAVYHVDLATDESEQFSGVAVVEVLGATALA